MELQLIRTCYPHGVNGVLWFQGTVLCKTVELPWRNNQRGISCIPEGTYRICKRSSPKFNDHFEVMGVKDRKYILIHAANDAEKELRGCIAAVMQHTGEGKGTASRIALQRLKDRLYPLLEKGITVTLTLKNMYHEKTYAKGGAAHPTVFPKN